MTTELEAVNVMLATIGEAPINSLTGPLPVDVGMAKSILDETRQKVCALGWWFNTETNVDTSLNASNEVVLPTNVLRVRLTTPGGIVAVQRGNRLYNATKHTYVWEQAPQVDYVLLLDWDELPEPARQYIMHRAARLFHARIVGAPEIDSMASRDEMQALAELQSAEAEAAVHTIYDNWRMLRLYTGRRY